MPLRDFAFGLFGRRARAEDSKDRGRGAALHVIILDGTMSSLAPGRETNAGQAFKLLKEMIGTANLTVYYEAGIQWRDWRSTWDVMTGVGINRQIKRAYGVLASRYRPGDRIILLGYSRGAFAVRSLAGVIERVGLVRKEEATERLIARAYRHYRSGGQSEAAKGFAQTHCHQGLVIDALGVFDTVKALGLRLPLVWRWGKRNHDFHDDALGAHIANGFQALALDEDRAAYAPLIWRNPPGWQGRLLQVWFRGVHADIGGQVGAQRAARPLANIPLVWMLTELSACGLPLPPGWQGRFAQDVTAPSIGKWQGWAKLFLNRRRRRVGEDPSEYLHPSVTQDAELPGLPRLDLHNETGG